jgi:hypothetical protein
VARRLSGCEGALHSSLSSAFLTFCLGGSRRARRYPTRGWADVAEPGVDHG